MNLDRLLDDLADRLRTRRRVVRLPSDRPIVFVGDTHGDREATERVLARFAVPKHVIVFLGDIVDRGPDSLGNLELVLSETIARPDSVHLLMGNHEAWNVASFSPADFWDTLEPDDVAKLGDALSRLPFAAWHPAGVLGVHGALPDVPSLDAIDAIELGSEAWRAITWGDWNGSQGGGLPAAGWGRPSFGPMEFNRRMEQLDARILVRSHQPFSPTFLFDDRCLTVFTSCAYGDGVRRVAVLRPDRYAETARGLDLIEL
jgi:hypothetical protein